MPLCFRTCAIRKPLFFFLLLQFLQEHLELLNEWPLRLLWRSGSIDSFAAEVDNNIARLRKAPLGARGRAARGGTLEGKWVSEGQLTKSSNKSCDAVWQRGNLTSFII